MGTDIQILTEGQTDRQILRDRQRDTEIPINRHYKYILSVSLYVLFVRTMFRYVSIYILVCIRHIMSAKYYLNDSLAAMAANIL